MFGADCKGQGVARCAAMVSAAVVGADLVRRDSGLLSWRGHSELRFESNHFQAWKDSVRGLMIAGARDVTVRGNSFDAAAAGAAHWGAAVEISNASDCVVESNVISGPFADVGEAIRVLPSADNVSVSGNTVGPDTLMLRTDDGEAKRSASPSFLFILIDDVGWGDVQWNGGTAVNPRIEEWARSDGTLVMQDMHSGGSVCSPTRASVLTGRHHFRDCVNTVYGCADMTECVPHFVFAPERTFTIGDAVRAANKNYKSWHGGKVSATPARIRLDIAAQLTRVSAVASWVAVRSPQLSNGGPHSFS